MLAEFAYNSSLSRTFKASPFEVVYGIKLLSVLDLAPLSLSEKENVRAKKKKKGRKFMQSVHAQVKENVRAKKKKKEKVYAICPCTSQGKN